MIHEFRNSIPVVVTDENGGKMDGEAIYVRDGSTWNNDVWAVALCETGRVIHVLSDKIRIYRNATYGIAVGDGLKSTPVNPPDPNQFKDYIIGAENSPLPPRWSDEDLIEFCAFSKYHENKIESLEKFKFNKEKAKQ